MDNINIYKIYRAIETETHDILMTHIETINEDLECYIDKLIEESKKQKEATLARREAAKRKYIWYYMI